MALRHIQPDGLHRNRAFSPGVIVDPGAILIVGGQNAVDPAGKVVGIGDLAAQTVQALANLRLVLDAAGAASFDIFRLSIAVVGGIDLRPALAAWQAFWPSDDPPPVITVLRVAGLAHPDFMIEIEAQVRVREK